MINFIYYVSFGDKNMKVTINANSRKEADEKLKAKLVVVKCVEERDSSMDKINDMFSDIMGVLCSNPLHKVEVKLRGSCSKCKGTT